jgi:4-hydroxybenzoate polyprenyltransferase
MYVLQIVVIVTLLLINLLFIDSTNVHLTFGAVLIFTILARFWFFAEKWIKPSLPLALLTHNPVAYLHQLYLLSFFTLSFDVVFGREGFLLVSVGFLATAWEISRKIRGTEQEDAYTTYSKVWGPRVPPLLVCALLSASFLTTGYLIGRQGSPWMILLWIIPLAALLRLYFQSFQFLKDSRKAPAFRLSVEGYAFATIVVLVVSYFLI